MKQPGLGTSGHQDRNCVLIYSLPWAVGRKSPQVEGNDKEGLMV